MVNSLIFKGDCLILLDQRALPAAVVEVCCSSATDVAEAIGEMVVRGAPAIGIAAAYGIALEARRFEQAGVRASPEALAPAFECLRNSRPTAVNLFWALDRMQSALDGGADAAALAAAARTIHEEDLAANEAMGAYGAALIEPGRGVLTHCNTGALATGGHGTALGVIRTAWAQGRIDKVYADETRPWLQGARLTMWELMRESIPATLICEGSAASLMAEGRVGWVVVGADRIAANGDTANKIGTYGLAVLARYHGVRFMVVAPTSTLDFEIADGTAIPIETRPEREVLECGGHPVAPSGAAAWNPSFDVTPAGLIDAIVTERGVVERPDSGRLSVWRP
ncbi:MAG: S-methyl-5-thioribose-1-phosphate isomerase [Halothiobacillaceae bacterium]